jgi:hypothetical protein
MNGILYYDCFAGISGDMNLGALVGLGVDQKYLIDELKKLGLHGYELTFKNDVRRGISGTLADVKITAHANHVHSVLQMQDHDHENRSFNDIKTLIEKSEISDFAKNKSIAIFRKLAEAEGKIHNVPIEKVHFHEVGAIDSIVDIVGTAICIDFLKPSKIIASRIELGSGMVKCAHGTYPVPAPATLEVLKGIPVKSGTVPFEATTPTGAAILATIVDEFIEKPNFTIEKTSYGIGHKDSDVPNVLRVSWCSPDTSKFKTETTTIIECNIDDMNPETFDYLMEKLFINGADDVYFTPIIMKKSRPAIILSAMCKPAISDKLLMIILSETSTIGVRTYEATKHILDRKIYEIETSIGKVRIKKSWFGANIIKYKPEYDDCSRIAKELNLPFMEVLNIINREIEK